MYNMLPGVIYCDLTVFTDALYQHAGFYSLLMVRYSFLFSTYFGDSHLRKSLNIKRHDYDIFTSPYVTNELLYVKLTSYRGNPDSINLPVSKAVTWAEV